MVTYIERRGCKRNTMPTRKVRWRNIVKVVEPGDLIVATSSLGSTVFIVKKWDPTVHSPKRQYSHYKFKFLAKIVFSDQKDSGSFFRDSIAFGEPGGMFGKIGETRFSFRLVKKND